MSSLIRKTDVSEVDDNYRQNILNEILFQRNSHELSLDLLMDIIENLLLDCKSVVKCNSNRYLNQFFQRYDSFMSRLARLRPSIGDFRPLKVIGQGAFGQVQLVRHRSSERLYALKVLNKCQMLSQEGSVCWMHERDVMANFNSRWLVHLAFAFQDSRRLYMVMEYVPGGNLLNWIEAYETSPAEDEVRFYAAEMVLAIAELHRHNFVHRDIKPENVLIDAAGHLKLADFGSSVQVDAKTGKSLNCSRAVGTPDYISPEVLLSQQDGAAYGSEVDWWAFGALMYEVWAGDPPFYSDRLALTYTKIMAFSKYLTFEVDGQQVASDDAVSLMKGLLCERDVRLGSTNNATDLKEHPFFSRHAHAWTWDNIHMHTAPFVPQLDSECDTSNFEPVDPEDASRANAAENCTELTSKVFCGENLQFVGFSLSNLSELATQAVVALPSNGGEGVAVEITGGDQDESIAGEEMAELRDTNEALTNQLQQLVTQHQSLKASLDKLMVEKHDIETVLDGEKLKTKTTEATTKQLQKNLSDLMTKHGQSDKKISKLEEERHKLCGEMAGLKSSVESASTDATQLRAELAHSRGRCVELESEAACLRKRESGGSEQMQGIAQALLRAQQDRDQQEHEVVTLRQQTRELQERCDRQTVTIQERAAALSKLNKEIERYRKSSEESIKNEKTLNFKIAKLLKARMDDKNHFDQNLEQQRQQFNGILEARTHEMTALRRDWEDEKKEKACLEGDLFAEKTKCTQLVEKIDQILTGKSSTAHEMMINEKQKRGFLTKKNAKMSSELSKQNKKLQSMLDDLHRQANKKETEYKDRLHEMLKDKDSLEAQVLKLNHSLSCYESMAMVESSTSSSGGGYLQHNNAPSRHQLAGQNSIESSSPSDSGMSGSLCRVVRPPLSPATAHHQQHPPPVHTSSVTDLQKDASAAVRIRHNYSLGTVPTPLSSAILTPASASVLAQPSFSFPPSAPVCLPITLLEFNIKKKAKKMSWEKRSVKVESDFIVFYDEGMSVCLRLPLICILFVRSINRADAIHAKLEDIDRIFGLSYDRCQDYLYRLLQQQEQQRGSMLSLASSQESPPLQQAGTDSSSSRTNSICIEQDGQPPPICPAETLDKRVSNLRKSSLGRLLPSMLGGGSRSLSSTPGKCRLALSWEMQHQHVVLARGHLFRPQVSASILTEWLVKHEQSSCSNKTPEYKSAAAVAGIEAPSSRVQTDWQYQCDFCSQTFMGEVMLYSPKTIFSCPESVTMQLCRTRSPHEQRVWMRAFNDLLQQHQRT